MQRCVALRSVRAGCTTLDAGGARRFARRDVNRRIDDTRPSPPSRSVAAPTRTKVACLSASANDAPQIALTSVCGHSGYEERDRMHLAGWARSIGGGGGAPVAGSYRGIPRPVAMGHSATPHRRGGSPGERHRARAGGSGRRRRRIPNHNTL